MRRIALLCAVVIGATGCIEKPRHDEDAFFPIPDAFFPMDEDAGPPPPFTPGRTAWAVRWDTAVEGATSGTDPDLVANAAGDVAVLGWTLAGEDVDPGPGETRADAATARQFFVTSFTRDGTTRLARVLDARVERAVVAIGADASITLAGSIRISDRPASIDLDPGPGVDEHAFDFGVRAFVTRLAPDGTHLWSTVTPDALGSNGSVTAIAVDDLGAVLLAGHFVEPGVDFDPGATSDVAHALRDGSGAAQITSYAWRLDPSGAHVSVWALPTAIDRIFLHGGDMTLEQHLLYEGDIDPGPGVDVHGVTGFDPMGVARGEALMSRFVAGSYVSSAALAYPLTVRAAAVDARGTMFLGGTIGEPGAASASGDLDPSSGIDTRSGTAFALAARSRDERIWAEALVRFPEMHGATPGPSGEVYLAGDYDGTGVPSSDFGGSDVGLWTLRGERDGFLARVLPGGRLAWIVGTGGDGTERVHRAAGDGARRIYLLGTFDGRTEIGLPGDAIALDATAGRDTFLVAIDDEERVPPPRPVLDGGVDASVCSRTCEDVGAECGRIDDGCGYALNCGGCRGLAVCGGGGEPNRCAPRTTVLVDGLDHPTSMAVGDTDVVIGVRGAYPAGSGALGAVLAVPKTGGPVRVLALAPQGAGVDDVAIADGSVYFVTRSGADAGIVARVPLAGGAVETLDVGSDPRGGVICVSRDWIYVGQRTIRRLPRAGGAWEEADVLWGTTPLATSLACPIGTDVYYTANDTWPGSMVASSGRVDFYDVPGFGMRSYARWSIEWPAFGITVDGTRAYWWQDQAFVSLPRDAVSSTPPEIWTGPTPTTAFPSVVELGLDGTLLLLGYGTGASDARDGALYRSSRVMGSAPATLIEGLFHPLDVVEEAGAIYVLEEGLLSSPGGAGRVARIEVGP